MGWKFGRFWIFGFEGVFFKLVGFFLCRKGVFYGVVGVVGFIRGLIECVLGFYGSRKGYGGSFFLRLEFSLSIFGGGFGLVLVRESCFFF